ncbi:MAG: CoB--CoM heterodisulfide reductase iron-sulfur subunit A family protein [Methanomassiliicoccales archaeon]|nr:MAG: CoB--CoM heterodisulfide reductase iron-sulfur subunit A family protein [Methanomassiliicoccales archaeon]
MIRSALVIGGGISGMQAALNLANQGVRVTMVEREVSIGGIMPKLDKTFPTLDCAMCILSPFMVDCSRHSNIEIMTLAEVDSVSRQNGGFKVRIKQLPRYVLLDKCTGCGTCQEKCPKKVPDEFNMGLDDRKLIYFLFPQSIPQVPRIDYENCTYFRTGKCKVCEKFCEAGAIDFDQKEEIIERDFDSIVIATGGQIFKPDGRKEYGYGEYENVITSLELERLLSASGPTMGDVLTKDGKHPKKVAFVNCVGSRDEKVGHDYCSRICCMYGLKEALLLKEHDPDVEITIFYMDIRSFGKGYDEFYRKVRYEDKIADFVRARPAEIWENQDMTLSLHYEDTQSGDVKTLDVDMVVLNVAIVPSEGTKELAEKLGVELNNYGFFEKPNFSVGPLDASTQGIYICGMASRPLDITDSTSQGIGTASRATSDLQGDRTFPPPAGYPGLETDEKRIGVFVCHCGKNIASVVDVKELAEYAKGLPGVVYSEDNIFTCSEEGQRKIVEAIERERLTRVVVAACSPRTHEPTFQDAILSAGLNPFLLDMANIRNHCSWVHSDKDEALEKSKDLVRMSVARVANLDPLSRSTVGVTPIACVVGGGIAGLVATRDLAKNGFEVHLLERKPYLGGRVAKLGKIYPEESKASDLLDSLIKSIIDTEKVHFHLASEIAEVEGFVGNFEVAIESRDYVTDKCDGCDKCIDVCPVEVDDDFNEGLSKRRAIFKQNTYPEKYYIDPESCTLCGECVKACSIGAIDLSTKNKNVKCGALVVATGFEAGDREDLLTHGFGSHKGIITTSQVERLLHEDGPTGGNIEEYAGKVENVAVLLCADMRWGKNNYCSRYCCVTGTKAAKELKKRFPDSNIFVLYEDLRTIGIYEDLYKEVQSMGVTFIKYSFDNMPSISYTNGLRLQVKDELLGVELKIPLDLLVLSEGGIPVEGSDELAKKLRVPCSTEGFFQEAHVKLAPVDTSNEGVYIAGGVQYPKDVSDAVSQGSAAAARALTILSRDVLEVGGAVAHITPEKCAACLTCVRLCPYGAIFINEDNVAEVNIAKCRGCGICTSECPAKAIVLRHFQDDQLLPMVDEYLLEAVHGS